MISNLASAKALLQADLEHARNVLDLWAHQVTELEKALAQIEEVFTSRDALRVKYQALAHARQAGQTGAGQLPAVRTRARTAGTQGLNGINPAVTGKPDSVGRRQKRGRSDAAIKSGPAPAKSKRQGKKNTARAEARYQDPQSGKTWSGHGRPPAWLVGDREQYAL
jgi:hypothetical protein